LAGLLDATAEVAAEEAEPEPPAFWAVTTTRMKSPRSEEATV